MDAIGEVDRVGLLLRRQQLPLPDCMNGGVGVLPELRQARDINEINRHLHRLRHVHGDGEDSPVGADLQWGRHVENRVRLFGAFYAIRVVPIQAPIKFPKKKKGKKTLC